MHSERFQLRLRHVAAALALSALVPSLAGSEVIVPVVRRLDGTLTVSDIAGNQHRVASTQRVTAGESITTSSDASAELLLADVGHARLGALTSALVASDNGTFRFALSNGTACVTAESKSVEVAVGHVLVRVQKVPAVFGLERETVNVRLAVYAGSVSVTNLTNGSDVLTTGEARVGADGKPLLPAQLAVVNSEFVGLQCADQAAIAAAVATPPAAPSGKPTAAPSAPPLAAPSPVSLPVATAVPSAVPPPAATPLPTPVVTPLPTPLGIPFVAPLATPVPTPPATPVPTPLPTPLGIPIVAPLAVPAASVSPASTPVP